MSYPDKKLPSPGALRAWPLDTGALVRACVRNYVRRYQAVALALLAATTALACGVDAPFQLLANRQWSLNAPVANSFEYELSLIAGPPADHLEAQEQQGESGPQDIEGPDVAEARAAESGPRAFEIGQALPADVRLYTAGAVAYRQGEFEQAQEYFRQVLAVPDDTGRARATWAAYMIGRIAAETDRAAAAQQFRLTRSLAQGGAPDPLGLAVASFGEEARLSFSAATELAGTGALPPELAASYVGELATAAHLYLQQFARKSVSGRSSLRMLAQHVLAEESRLAAAAQDGTVRRVVVAYLLAKQSLSLWEDVADYAMREDHAWAARVLADAATPLEDADRLAALAYQEGLYDLARRLAARAEGPLAAWIRAKLALQQGDTAAAAAAYAEALRALPGGARPGTAENQGRLRGEAAVLALAGGEFLQAAELLFDTGYPYWSDLSHVAERVLTIDELKALVDRKAPPSARKDRPQPYDWTDDQEPPLVHVQMDFYTLAEAPTMAELLRGLLARRMMRAGRHAEALAYFSADALRAQAAAYTEAFARAAQPGSGTSQAEAWFSAGKLLRRTGMEIMGTEGAPDFAYWRGQYAFGVGQPAETLQGPLINQSEQTRYADSAITPDLRFHYRYVAVAHAMRAADLLPSRSQAFAAILCHAASWAARDPEQVKAIYARYVKDGALVPFARHFGENCPDPDFAAAPGTQRRFLMRQVRRWLTGHIGPVAGGAMALACVSLWWWRRQRRDSLRAQGEGRCNQ